MSEMQAEDFHMLYWRDGPVWKRFHSTSLERQVGLAINNLRALHGPSVAYLLVHHPRHAPLPATTYDDAGLARYLVEVARVQEMPTQSRETADAQ